MLKIAVKAFLLALFLEAVSGAKCKLGEEEKAGKCVEFACTKGEECKAKFGEFTTECHFGKCACSTAALVVDEDGVCSNKTLACKINHCPDFSACVKGKCFCNVGYSGVEVKGELSCVQRNCTQNADFCQTVFGDNTECLTPESMCDCKQMYYWDHKTMKCAPQLDMAMGLSVAGVFVVIVVAPVVVFNILM